MVRILNTADAPAACRHDSIVKKMPAPKETRTLTFRLVRGLLVAIAGAYLLVVGAIWHWR
jgi:hypothetical protein